MQTTITPEQWSAFEQNGYVKLGNVAGDEMIRNLQQRIDDIMLGRANVNYEKMSMQLDTPNDDYEKDENVRLSSVTLSGPGHKGATLNYRKIQDLEFDPFFLRFIQLPIFAEACQHLYGEDTPIAVMRAMFMNKPAGRGMSLRWHQDAWNFLDQTPILTTWTALDPATRANGCVKIVPGSHRARINPSSANGFLTPEQTKKHCQDKHVVYMELEAGETVLLHNWLLHSSERNNTNTSRRAFSNTYMNADTQRTDAKPYNYTPIFGPGALQVEKLEVNLDSNAK